MKATIKSPCLTVLALLVFSTSLLAEQPGAPAKRRLEPAMDLADAPAPQVANQRARASFDRARQSLQRVRSLNQASNARRNEREQDKDATPKKRRPRRKPAKGR